jgi:hypothetical protein
MPLTSQCNSQPALIAQLSQQQKEVLWLGRGQELDPRYEQEREKEHGKVSWGVVFPCAKM